MNIPQCNPEAGYQRYKTGIDAAISRVLNGGCYILSKEVETFERDFAVFCGAASCIGVANGTDALEIILRGLDIGHGDHVITVANTAVATVAAIERTGASPLFVDIEPKTFTMSPESLENILRTGIDRVKAVIAVHLFGHPADMKGIMAAAQRYALPVIEDCAQAHGAKIDGKTVGTIGIAGAFSFYPTKNLGAIGDGGAVVTGNVALVAKIKALRQYGWVNRYISDFPGINSRLDELQAAILNVKLGGLATNNERRRKIANIYHSRLYGLAGLMLPVTIPGVEHVFHQFVIKCHERDRLRTILQSAGIGTAIHYPVPIHLQPAYLNRIPLLVPLTETERVNPLILSLPMFPELPDADAEAVCQAIIKAMGA